MYLYIVMMAKFGAYSVAKISKTTLKTAFKVCLIIFKTVGKYTLNTIAFIISVVVGTFAQCDF